MLGSHGRSWSGMLVLSPVRCSYLGKGGGGVTRSLRVTPLSKKFQICSKNFHFLRNSLPKPKNTGGANRLRNLVRARILSALKSLTLAVRISRVVWEGRIITHQMDDMSLAWDELSRGE